jgi:uncharacterized protein involved in type VI secretion and phage assembly
VLGDTSDITLSKKITGSHSPWDYCVQYRETDFAFVSRLMEHRGHFGYHFEHAQEVADDGRLRLQHRLHRLQAEADVETAQGFASPATKPV